MLRALGFDSMNPPTRWLKASVVRRTVFAVVLFLLITTPLVALLAAMTLGSNLHRAEQFTPFYFPIWAVFAVWVVLDSPAVLGLLGPRPDPFGPKAATF